MYITRENANTLLGASLNQDIWMVLRDRDFYDRYAENVISDLKMLGEYALARRLEARRVEWMRVREARRTLRTMDPDSPEYEEAEEQAMDPAELDPGHF